MELADGSPLRVTTSRNGLAEDPDRTPSDRKSITYKTQVTLSLNLTNPLEKSGLDQNRFIHRLLHVLGSFEREESVYRISDVRAHIAASVITLLSVLVLHVWRTNRKPDIHESRGRLRHPAAVSSKRLARGSLAHGSVHSFRNNQKL